MNSQNGFRKPQTQSIDQFPSMKQLSRYQNFGKTLAIVNQKKDQEHHKNSRSPVRFQSNFKPKMALILPKNDEEKN